MNFELSQISPFSAFLGSFFSPLTPAWLLMILATVFFWFGVLAPATVVISFLDRKISADIQRRVGPNRTGPYGLFQWLSDCIKFFFKEDLKRAAREPVLVALGPVIALAFVFCSIASVPVSRDFVLSDVEGSLIWIFGAIVFSNLTLFWTSYASSKKGTVLSGYRLLVVMSSYVVPVGVALLSPVLVSGTANLRAIVNSQGGFPWQWIFFHGPGGVFSGVVLFWSLLIWQGRAPFDVASNESEFSAGIVFQFSGVRQAFLIILEYATVFLSCELMVALFFGSYITPFDLEFFGRGSNLVEFICFWSKVFGLVYLVTWLRWSLPKFRIDQLVSMSWKFLVPTGVVGVVLTAAFLVMGRSLK